MTDEHRSCMEAVIAACGGHDAWKTEAQRVDALMREHRISAGLLALLLGGQIRTEEQLRWTLGVIEAGYHAVQEGEKRRANLS